MKIFSIRNKKFRVLIEGNNVLMNQQGIQRFGFFATRYVKAKDSETASQQAIASAKKELFSTESLLNETGDPPVFEVSEVSPIETFKGLNSSGEGFTFYRM